MKAMKLSSLLMTGMMLVGLSTMAQNGEGMKQQGNKSCCSMEQGKKLEVPNLTEDQKTKIKDLKITHQKQMLIYRNQMGELKAKEQTLTTADKADMKAINANIDEITKVKNQMMKAKAQHQQDVRALLNPEQKLWFDTHKGKGKRMDGKTSANRMQNSEACQQDSMKMQHKGHGRIEK